jgi:hypothetical protein
MDKANCSSDQYNVFGKTLSSSTQFNTELFNDFAQVYRMYLSTISEYNESWKNFTELDKTLISRSHKIFDEKVQRRKIR